MKPIKPYLNKALSAAVTAAMLFGMTSSAGISANAAETYNSSMKRSFLFGDLNNDGNINVLDINLMSSFISKETVPTDEQKIIGDVDGSGTLDDQDKLYIQRYMSDQSYGLPVTNTLTDYGYCGGNVKYMLDNKGTLTIFGTGEMYNFQYSAPWKTDNQKDERVKKVIIKDGVTSIGNYTFHDHTALSSVAIGKNVKSIGSWAFEYCPKLESITIPGNVETIGEHAFEACSGLKSISFNSGLKTIGKSAFYNCSSLASVSLPYSVESVGTYCFYGCSAMKSAYLSSSLKSLPGCMFIYCSGLESVSLPYNLTTIGASCFEGCSSLKGISLPGTLTTISQDAFSGCSALKRVIIPEKVTEIPYQAFQGCTSLNDVILPESVAKIGVRAFWRCRNLAAVKIYNDRITIDDSAFNDCGSVAVTGHKNSNAESYAASKNIPFTAFRTVNTVVTLDSDGKTIDLTDKTTYSGLPELKKSGYDFKGWKLNGTNENSSLFTEDTDIYFRVPEYWYHAEEYYYYPESLTIYCHLWKIKNTGVINYEDPIYFVDIGSKLKNKSSGKVYACFYNEDNTLKMTWPGTAMTESGTDESGYIRYSVSIPAGATHVVFSDGETKYTQSIKITSGAAYYISESYSSPYTVKITDQITNLYEWKSDGEICEYVGEYEDGRVYKYTIPAGSDVNAVIFASSNYNQINDISIGTACANDMLSPTNLILHHYNYFSDSGRDGMYGEWLDAQWTVNKEFKSLISTECFPPLTGSSSSYNDESEDYYSYWESHKDNYVNTPYDIKTVENKYVRNGDAIVLPASHKLYADIQKRGYNIIEFDSRGSEDSFETLRLSEDGHVTVPYDYFPHKDGYVFRGWDTDINNEAGRYWPAMSYTFTEDTVLYAIWKRPIEDCELHLSGNTYTYDGTEKKPSVTVTDGTKTLTSADYTVTYSSNVNAGTAKVIVQGKGGYDGSLEAVFTINPMTVANAELTVNPSSYIYDGNAKQPAVTVKLGGRILVKDTEYTVAYSANTNAGTAKVTVTGKGNFTGSREASFNISRRSISNAEIAVDPSSYTYDGNAKKPSVTLTDGTKMLTEGKDYELSYENNISAGSGKVIINGINNYIGSVEKFFTIKGKSIATAELTLSPTTFTYDGNAKKPSVTLTDGTKTLTEGKDYELSYENNISAGSGKVIINGINNYIGSVEKFFTIKGKSIANAELTISPTTFTYDGNAKKPSVTLTDGTKTLTEGKDYELSYENNISAGSGKVIINGINNYIGSVEKFFTIKGKSIANAELTISPTTFTYDGNAKKPAVTLTDGTKTLTEGTDYKLSYENNISAGSGKVIINGINNYIGSVEKFFTIKGKSIANAELTLSPTAYTYNGGARKPSVTVTLDGKTLVRDTDYTVTYSANTNAGTAKATVTGKGNYSGTVSGEFSINAKSLAGAELPLSPTAYTYNGNAKKPSVTVTLDGKTLVKDTDYTVTYSANTNAGTAKATVTGKGNYSGTVSGEFSINAKSLAGAELTLSPTAYTYNGGARKPSVTVTLDGRTLVKDTDYTVTYSANTNAGTAKATVTGKGNYSGTATGEFRISRFSVTACSVTLDPDTYTYDGTAKKPGVSVNNGSKALVIGTDYALTYSNNIEAGTASVTVTGKGNYTGSVTKSFTISAKPQTDIGSFLITVNASHGIVYDGNPQQPGITVQKGKKMLKAGTDYSYTYSNNINAGQASVTITGMGEYTGSVVRNFTIEPMSVRNAVVKVAQTTYVYNNGLPQTPDVEVVLDGKTLVRGKEYSVSYSDNVNIGMALITVKGIKNYKDTTYGSFSIISGKKAFTWGQDNWSFINSSYNGDFLSTLYKDQINSHYVEKLKQNLTNKEYETLFIRNGDKPAWMNTKFDGSCYGMSAVVFLAYAGFMKYGDYQSGASKLYDFDAPSKHSLNYPSANSNISSLITYYQMIQVKDVIRQRIRDIPTKSNEYVINGIIDLLRKNPLVMIGYKQEDFGGHSVVALGHEYGSWTFNGVTYGGRILVYDPNYSKAHTDEADIYYNTKTYEWVVPIYSTYKVSSLLGAQFNYFGADLRDINCGGYLSGVYKPINKDEKYISRIDANKISANRSVVKVKNEGGSYMNHGAAPGEIVEDYSYILSGDAKGTAGYNLFDSESAYKIYQFATGEIDVQIDYEYCDLAAKTAAGKSVIFDKDGVIQIQSSQADYTLSMTWNEDYPTDWFSIIVSGSDADNVTLEKAENGYILSADNLKGLKIKANNRSETVTAGLSATKYRSVLIYETDSRTLGIRVDADNNGTYETDLHAVSLLENTSDISAAQIKKGSTVNVTASAVGGTRDYSYSVLYKKSTSDKWTTVQGYSSNSTVSIKPASSGEYDICVKARDTKGTIEKKYFTLMVIAELKNDSTISATSISKGSSVTVKADATGGTGGYEYAVYYRKASSSAWTLKQNYSTNSRVSIKLAESGTYDIYVKARDSAGSLSKKYFTVTVSSALVNRSTVSSTSLKLGASLTVKAAASGGAGGYQYAIYWKKASSSSWVKKQDYSTNTTVVLKPAAAVDYNVYVKVRDSKGTVVKKTFTVSVEK